MYLKQLTLGFNEMKYMKNADKYRRNEVLFTLLLTLIKPLTELMLRLNQSLFDTKEYNVSKHYFGWKKAASNQKLYDLRMKVWTT